MPSEEVLKLARNVCGSVNESMPCKHCGSDVPAQCPFNIEVRRAAVIEINEGRAHHHLRSDA